MTKHEEMICMTMHIHPAHDWTYQQDWGGSKDFDYHCPGIKLIVITDLNGKEHRR